MDAKEKKLEMYGGLWGGLAPLLILIAVLVWISVNGKGSVSAFWTGGWLALVAGLFLAKDKKKYCQIIIHGIGSKTGATIVAAWLFAGVLLSLIHIWCSLPGKPVFLYPKHWCGRRKAAQAKNMR